MLGVLEKEISSLSRGKVVIPFGTEPILLGWGQGTREQSED